jgi:hypothetical protein
VVAVGAFSAWLFAGVTQDVVAHEEVVRYDPGILRFAVSHRQASLTVFMKATTWLGSDAVLIPLVAALSLWYLLRRRSWRPAVALIAALAGASVVYWRPSPESAGETAAERPPLAA